MHEKLIIWITDAGTLDARWLVLDTHGNRVGFPQSGMLADAAAAANQRRVILMVPGERVLSAQARVPGKNPKRILQAAPYALEDRLAGDVDALHVALLNRDASQLCDFLVVEREWLSTLLDHCDTAGIHPEGAWPDYLGVPGENEHANWMITGTERLLAREGLEGFSAAVGDAPFLFSRRDTAKEFHLIVVGDQPAPAALGDPEMTRLQDDERAFTELAATISTLPGAGLLQGVFRRNRESTTEWRRWRWPAVAAVTTLVLLLADFGMDAWRLQREQAFLENATRELFQQALPGNQRMVDPRFQVEQALGGSAAVDSLLLDYLARVAKVVSGLPNARLNGFNYRNERFELSVTVPNASMLERLRDELAADTALNVDVQSANSTTGGLEGRLLLAQGGS